MNAINNSNVYNDFLNFAAAQIRAGDKTAIARFETREGGGGRAVVRCADGDYVGRIGSLRGSERASANNAVRDCFLRAVLDHCGKTKIDELPAPVRKQLLLKDFGLDGEGKATSGKPLTARRIKAVNEAIKKSVLMPNQDPTSATPMKQSGELNNGALEGTGLCYVNSIINALKRTKNGQAYLSKLFRPDGCTLYATHRDTKTRTETVSVHQYEYSKCKDYPRLGLKHEEKFSLLERTMLHHKRRHQTTQNGGSPKEGAEMLGLKKMEATEAWPYGQEDNKDKVINLIRAHLDKGRFVIPNIGYHYTVIIDIVADKDKKNYGECTYVDDIDGKEHKRTFSFQSFHSNDYYVITPPDEKDCLVE